MRAHKPSRHDRGSGRDSCKQVHAGRNGSSRPARRIRGAQLLLQRRVQWLRLHCWPWRRRAVMSAPERAGWDHWRCEWTPVVASARIPEMDRRGRPDPGDPRPRPTSHPPPLPSPASTHCRSGGRSAFPAIGSGPDLNLTLLLFPEGRIHRSSVGTASCYLIYRRQQLRGAERDRLLGGRPEASQSVSTRVRQLSAASRSSPAECDRIQLRIGNGMGGGIDRLTHHVEILLAIGNTLGVSSALCSAAMSTGGHHEHSDLAPGALLDHRRRETVHRQPPPHSPASPGPSSNRPGAAHGHPDARHRRPLPVDHRTARRESRRTHLPLARWPRTIPRGRKRQPPRTWCHHDGHRNALAHLPARHRMAAIDVPRGDEQRIAGRKPGRLPSGSLTETRTAFHNRSATVTSRSPPPALSR